MTSRTMIDNLERWEMMCSVSGVFTVISQWLLENKSAITLEETREIQDLTIRYLGNNIMSLRNVVAPEIQPQARQLLYDYWGEDFVNQVEKMLDASASS